MKEDTTIPPPPGLAEINQAYDSTFSYVVIEQRLKAGGASDFQKVDEALVGLKTEIVDQELVADPRTGDKRLIIKMRHRETEEIMLAFLGAGLEAHFHCYVY